MFNIGDYLEKFKKIGLSEQAFKETVSVSIKEVVGLEIKTDDLIFRNGELIINASPAVKNTLFIKKESILNKIKEKGIRRPENIR
jgi:hypothetical protein